jgi:hypothetical protein
MVLPMSLCAAGQLARRAAGAGAGQAVRLGAVNARPLGAHASSRRRRRRQLVSRMRLVPDCCLAEPGPALVSAGASAGV